MKRYWTYLAAFTLVLPAFTFVLSWRAFDCPSAIRAQDGKSTKLTKSDAKFLDEMMEKFLFDPTGAERVRVKLSKDSEREGWHIAGKKAVYFTDGVSVAVKPDMITKIDFVSDCRKVLAKNRVPPIESGFAIWQLDRSELAFAAWLHRLGNDDQAAEMLALVRRAGSDGELLRGIRADLAWISFAGMVHGLCGHAEEDALAAGERLLRLYAAEAEEMSQAKSILADLRRRQEQGKFGKILGAKEPDGFVDWPITKRIEYWIDSLEDIDAEQNGFPGGVDLASDRRVKAIITLGDPAVSRLIDVLEKDNRMTRSIHMWRPWARSRTILSVREAALTALMAILQTQVFDPAFTGDSFTGRGEEEAAKTAKQLREYWRKYGRFPFDERMMVILTDPKNSPQTWREAADNLSRLGEKRTFGTTVFVGGIIEKRTKPNPAIAKFKNPTTAEAILAALDRESAANAGKDSDRDWLLVHYLSALADLGDVKIAPILAQRGRAAMKVPQRRIYSLAAYYLDEKGPMKELVDDFRAGKLDLGFAKPPPRNAEDDPGHRALAGLVSSLTAIDTPETNGALFELAGPNHPWHTYVKKQLLLQSAARSYRDDQGPWLWHPFAVRMLHMCLDDKTLTGNEHSIKENVRWVRDNKGSGSGGPIPAHLADPAKRNDLAKERACDFAALQLATMVAGMPQFDPLFKDADARIATMREFLNRYQKFRHVKMKERGAFGDEHQSGVFYLPDISLKEAATKNDVEAGRAIFHLDGKGKKTDAALPLIADLKESDPKKPESVLIVQAEQDSDGQVFYGVLGSRTIRRLSAEELVRIRPLDQDESQQKK
jgi:hypothetical protein